MFFSAEEHNVCGAILVGQRLDCHNTLCELCVRFRALKDEVGVNGCLALLVTTRGETFSNKGMVKFGENLSLVAEELFVCFFNSVA
jgi:hypothetical protein